MTLGTRWLTTAVVGSVILFFAADGVGAAEASVAEGDTVAAEKCYQQARYYATRGEVTSALAELGEAIRLNPQHPSARMDRARIYARQGDFDRAIADASEAVLLGRERTRWLEFRASLYQQKGDLKLARADLDRVIQDNEAVAPAIPGGDADGRQYRIGHGHLTRGDVRAWEGDFDAAITDYSAAIEAFERHNKASTQGTRRIAPTMLLAESHYRRGEAYEFKGDTARARADYCDREGIP